MPTLTLENLSAAPSEQPTADLALRINGGGLDGRTIRLSSAKCTVGSGPRCTLRLLGYGIRPLHCLIVRGSRGTFVRRWAPDTRLNGQSFEDAALRTGDRLTIGPLDLEVLQPTEAPLEAVESASLVARANPAAVPSDVAAGQAFPMPAAHTSEELAQLSADVRGQIAELRKQARRMVDALRKSRRQQQDLQAQVEASLVAQREAEARLGQINSSARAADERSSELEVRIAELAERVTALTTQVQAQQERQRELTAELELAQEREAALKLSGPAVAPGSQPRSGVEAEASDEWVEPATEADASDKAEAAIARLRELALWSDNSQVPADAAPPEPESRSRSGAPVSFIEKYAPHLLDDEGEDVTAAGPFADRGELRSNPSDPDEPDADAGYEDDPATSNDSPAEDETLSQPQAASSASDDDDSLEAYMAKLMQRVRGSDSQPRASQAPKPPERRPTPPPVANGPAQSTRSQSGQPQTAFKLEDMKRAAVPPERGTNFAAMRELANRSAHGAISTYRTERSTRDAYSRSFAGILCLASGVGILYFAPEALSAATAGGIAAIVAAIYFAVRGFWSSLVAIRGGGKAANARESQEIPVAAERPQPDGAPSASDESGPAVPAAAPAIAAQPVPADRTLAEGLQLLRERS